MKEKFLEFLWNEDGQTSTEYILLVAVVALIVIRFKKSATEQLDRLTNSIFGGTSNKILGELNQ